MRSLLSRLFGSLLGRKPRISCEMGVWAAGVRELKQRTLGGHRESGAFLLGRETEGQRRILEFVELEMEKRKNPSLELLTNLAAHFEVPVSHLLDESTSSDAMIFGREFAGATEEDKKLIWKMAEKMKLDKKPE